jgi:hypothetical protein
VQEGGNINGEIERGILFHTGDATPNERAFDDFDTLIRTDDRQPWQRRVDIHVKRISASVRTQSHEQAVATFLWLRWPLGLRLEAGA